MCFNLLRLYSPPLTLTQDKAEKAEEEAALLEEQSRDYKEQLDNALRQIEKLHTNPQSVGPHFFSPLQAFLILTAPTAWLKVAFPGAV